MLFSWFIFNTKTSLKVSLHITYIPCILQSPYPMNSDIFMPKLQIKQLPFLQWLAIEQEKTLLKPLKPHLCTHFFWRTDSPFVYGIQNDTVMPRGDFDKRVRPSHKLMVILQHQVLWTHLKGGHIQVLDKAHQKSASPKTVKTGLNRTHYYRWRWYFSIRKHIRGWHFAPLNCVLYGV